MSSQCHQMNLHSPLPPPSAIKYFNIVFFFCSAKNMTMLDVCPSASLWCLLGCISSSSCCSRGRRDDDDPDPIPAAAISQLVHNKLGKFLIGSRVTPHKCKEQLRVKKMLHIQHRPGRSGRINGTTNVFFPISGRYSGDTP